MIRDVASHSAPQKNMEAAQQSGQLTLAQEKLLARRWREHADPASVERLIRAHLGLVVRIASEFRHAGPSLEDLVQEGNVGLTIAARRFDPNRSTRLATYATYWIRACILEHVVRTHGPIRIGTTRAQRKIFFGLGRARRKLEGRGIPFGSAALAAELGVSVAEVESMTPRLNGRDISMDSGDTGPGREERRAMAEILPDSLPNPEQSCSNREENRTRWILFEAALRKLDPRERDILTSRHLQEQPETLSQLGKRFGLSRERVRQLETRAKLRMREMCSGQRPRRIFRHRPPE